MDTLYRMDLETERERGRNQDRRRRRKRSTTASGRFGQVSFGVGTEAQCAQVGGRSVADQ